MYVIPEHEPREGDDYVVERLADARPPATDTEAALRALGSVHLDDNGAGEPWLEVAKDRFRYITFALSGPTPAGRVFDRRDVETLCGPLVPLTY